MDTEYLFTAADERLLAAGGGHGRRVRIFEYPGSGSRPGPLGKTAFLAAGRAALQDLLAADPRPIFLLGESIGSGTACAQGRKVYERCPAPKLLITLAGVGHNSIDMEPPAPWFRQTAEFILRRH